MIKVYKNRKGEVFNILYDEEDFNLIKRLSIRAKKAGLKYYCDAYFYGENSKTKKHLHRIIMNCPDGLVVDHINGNPLDNRRSNLRICTVSENLRNKTSNISKKTSKYKGISYKKRDRLWCVCINSNYKAVYRKHFKTEGEAIVALKENLAIHHKEFSNYGF